MNGFVEDEEFVVVVGTRERDRGFSSTSPPEAARLRMLRGGTTPSGAVAEDCSYALVEFFLSAFLVF